MNPPLVLTGNGRRVCVPPLVRPLVCVLYYVVRVKRLASLANDVSEIGVEGSVEKLRVTPLA